MMNFEEFPKFDTVEQIADSVDKNNFSPDVRVEKLNPHPTEALVLRFNPGRIDLNELKSVFECIQSQFSNNVVVVIPDNISLRSCSKDVLENMISMISGVIDSL